MPEQNNGIKPVDLFKGMYERELARRYTLESATTLPISICSIIIALMYFLYNAIDAKNETWLNVSLAIIIAAVFALFLTILVFLAGAYNYWFKGFKYCDFPSPIALHDYQKRLENYNSHPEVTDEEKTHFDTYLIDNYVECADSFTKINDRRSSFLFRAKTFIIICIFIEVLGLIIYITPKIITKMSDNNNDPKPAQSIQPATPKPQPPVQPTNRVVNLNDELPSLKTSKPDNKKP